MTTPKKIKKAFDCVEVKRRAQVEIYKQIQGMTHEQERAYFEEQSERGPLGDWWRRIKAANQNRCSRQ